MFSSPVSKVTSFAATIILTLQANLAFAAGPADDAKGFALGGAIGQSGDAERAELQLRSPILFSKDGNGVYAGRYSLIGGYGAYGFRNMVVEGEANLDWTMAYYGTFGLRFEMPSDDGRQLFYGTYEAMYVNLPDNLADEASPWGGRFTAGAEWLMPKRTNWFDQELQPSFYVQGDIALGFERSDTLPGKPDLLNGLGLWVGSRTYF